MSQPKKPLTELTAVDDPAWPELAKLFAAAKNELEVLPRTPQRSSEALFSLQVTTRATLGALAFETGGVLVDGGWLRLYGGGSVALPRDLGLFNLPPEAGGKARLPGALVVADDAIGGFFAVNGGRFPGEQGIVHYLAPDTLQWESLDVGYTEWVHFCANGELSRFYDDLRWEDWEDDVEALAPDQAICFAPPLFAQGERLEARARRGVPLEELWGLHVVEWPAQLAASRAQNLGKLQS